MGQVEKEKKKNCFRYHFGPTRARAFPKNSKNNIQKIKKTSFSLHFQLNRAKTGQKRGQKNSFQASFVPDLALSNPKKFKKFKNVILTSFLAKLGQERKKKRKKNSFQVPFLLDLGWSIPKKIQKNSKNFIYN